jgi:hypothetical protein
MRRILAVGLVGVLLAGACSGGDDDAGAGSEEPAEASEDGGTWTILQYDMADTDLEPFMMEDLEEMGTVGSAGDLSLVALVDRSPDYGDDPVLGLDAWAGAKVLQIGADGSADVLDDLGDVDLGDPATLADFLGEQLAANPADHYGLVISDHGASWPGVGPDETSGEDTLDLGEIRQGIADGLDEAGVEQLDLLGFDACLMASYEVASTLQPVAHRLVASSELEPGHGWDYGSLQAAAEGASVDELGSAIVEGFLAQSEDEGDDADVTLAVLDLDRMADVDDALADLSGALADGASDLAPVVGRTLATTPSYGRSPDPDEDSHMTDLGAFASALDDDEVAVADEAEALLSALDDVVVTKVAGPQASEFSGLSIYFPPALDEFDDEYRTLPGAEAWTGFLDAFYDAGESLDVTRRPTFQQGDLTAAFDDDGLTVSGTLALAEQADNVAEATITYGIVDPDGTVTYIGDEPAELSDDHPGEVEASYDLTSLTLGDGEDTTYAYLSLTDDEQDDGYTIDVPMSYTPPDGGAEVEDVLLEVTVDEDGDVTDETYYGYDDAAGTYGELTADPTGIIRPDLLVVGPDGTTTWTPATDVGLFADLPNLEYDLPSLPSGTRLRVELSVTDFGGRRQARSIDVTVP